MNPGRWTSFLPEIATKITGLQPETLVLLNGWTEFTLAFFLLIGLRQKIVSIILGIHLIGIALEAGGAIGVRDLILGIACFAIYFAPTDKYSLDSYLNEIDEDAKN